MAIVYTHSKPDGEIFYVGISKNIYRPSSIKNRNKYWHNVVNKHGYVINILFNNVSYEEAKEIEMYLISYYGRKDLKTGNLVNMTIGGEGVVGNIVSEETKLKMSISKKGTIWNDVRRKNHKLACENRILSNETKKNMSLHNAKTKSKKTINTKTGFIYNTLLEACKDLGLNYNTTKAQVRGQNSNKTNLKYI